MRQAVCRALGEIGDPRAVEPLIERLRDEDEDVREAALEALKTSAKFKSLWEEMLCSRDLRRNRNILVVNEIFI